MLRARSDHINQPRETEESHQRFIRRHLVNDFRTPRHGVNESSKEFDARMEEARRNRIDNDNRFDRDRSRSRNHKRSARVLHEAREILGAGYEPEDSERSLIQKCR
jgi:hypothetical protein